MNKKIKNITNDIKKTLKPSKFDPFGSYTGLTQGKQQPVQDQDDL